MTETLPLVRRSCFEFRDLVIRADFEIRTSYFRAMLSKTDENTPLKAVN
jgi:hypothetical protein